MSFLVALVWMWFMLVLVISAMWCWVTMARLISIPTVPGTALVKTSCVSRPTDFGGVDEIIVGDGEDFVIAGGEGDRVNVHTDADGEPVQIG